MSTVTAAAYVALVLICLACAYSCVLGFTSPPARYNTRELNFGNTLNALCFDAIRHGPFAAYGYTPVPRGSQVPKVAFAGDIEWVHEFLQTSDLHETHPQATLISTSSLFRSAMAREFKTPSYPSMGGTTLIAVRCSPGDVPSLDNSLYELIEYSWYIRALSLIPAHRRRNVVLRSQSLSGVCAVYCENLGRYLKRYSGADSVKTTATSATVTVDFASVGEYGGFISGGCGGSFGFWCGACCSDNTTVVLPSTRNPRFCELGCREVEWVGNKAILRAQRVRNRDVMGYEEQNHVDGVIDLCYRIQQPLCPDFDGTTFVLGGPDLQDSQRNHAHLVQCGLKPRQFEPQTKPGGGVVSNASAHATMLREIWRRGRGWVLICEEGFVFSDPPSVAPKMISFLNDAADFAYVSVATQPGGWNTEEPTGLWRTSGSHAYCVTPEGADYLLWILEENGYLEDPTLHIGKVYENHVTAPLMDFR